MTASPDLQDAPDPSVEWLVGIASLATYVTENGAAYRPSAIVWLDAATELILETTVAPPQEAFSAAATHLRTAARARVAGRPAIPGRIRVASPELADALRREALDGVEVVCAPTPELDRALASLLKHFAANQEAEEPDLRYLESDATVEGTAAMFRAAAALYDVKPWEIVPTDNTLLGITSERLALRDAVVSVIGQAGQVHGFVLFASLDDFDRFGDASALQEEGQPASYPQHLALTYARRNEVGPALLAEIAAHRWKVAGARAYPVVTAIDEAGVGRCPTRAELLHMEAIAASLAEILSELPPELEDALDGGSPMTVRKTLIASGGETEIEIVVPAPGQQPDSALLGEDGTLDDDRVDAYRRSFLGRFEVSPEAKAEPAAHWGALLVDYAASYFGEPLTSLSSQQFREIVFEIIPRKVDRARRSPRTIDRARRSPAQSIELDGHPRDRPSSTVTRARSTEIDGRPAHSNRAGRSSARSTYLAGHPRALPTSRPRSKRHRALERTRRRVRLFVDCAACPPQRRQRRGRRDTARCPPTCRR